MQRFNDPIEWVVRELAGELWYRCGESYVGVAAMVVGAVALLTAPSWLGYLL